MNSRLNSISLRAQWLQNETKENIKKDSIIDFLQSSEIEFDSCPNRKNKLDNYYSEIRKYVYEEESEIEIEDSDEDSENKIEEEIESDL